MELVKKLLKSILILFGIACMVAVVLVAIMMIGKVEIFGLSYVSLSTFGKSIKIDIDTAGENKLIATDGTIESIVIKTNLVSPEIEFYGTSAQGASDATGIAIRFEYNLQGIAKGEVKTLSLVSTEPEQIFNSQTRVLTLETIEPEGLFFRNDCRLKVFLPYDMKLNNVDIEIGKAKSVVLNNNAVKKDGNSYIIKQFNLDSLRIKQTFANYNGLSIGKIAKWSLKNSDVKGENINMTIKDLTLETVAGRVEVCSVVSGDLNINSQSGTFVFDKRQGSIDNTVYSNSIGGSVIIRGDIPSVQLGTVSNQVVNLAKQGKDFQIEKQFNVNGQLLVECNALVQISGKTLSNIEINKSGATLRANLIGGLLSATSGCGGITVVGEVQNGEVLIGTDEDVNVTVNDVFINKITASPVTIRSNNKPVVINQLVNSNCDIKSKRGDIVVNSINNSTVTLVSENASIKANFAGSSINGHNIIRTEGSGNINVKFVDGQKFKLIATARYKDRIKINLISFDTTTGELEPMQTTDGSGFVYFEEQIYGNTNSANIVDLYSTSGTIFGGLAE